MLVSNFCRIYVEVGGRRPGLIIIICPGPLQCVLGREKYAAQSTRVAPQISISTNYHQATTEHELEPQKHPRVELEF